MKPSSAETAGKVVAILGVVFSIIWLIRALDWSTLLWVGGAVIVAIVGIGLMVRSSK